MKQNNMWGQIKLDSFDVDISFSASKKEIISLLHKKDISFVMPSEMQIVVKSKILSLGFDFFVAFYFNAEELIAIIITPDVALKGSILQSRYNEIQVALENELGYPGNLLRPIMNLLDPDSQLARWKKNGIKIEHYLLNRFGMEEIISIELASI